MRKLLLGIIIVFLTGTCAGCGKKAEQEKTYGVFLNYEGNLKDLEQYETVVIDAQYVDEKDILSFQAGGHKVYSYINIGSLEDFREYYDLYKDITLGAYEHWEEECWIDVSQKEWQDFLLHTLAEELLQKGIDGFFVDNCDVYYVYPNEDIFQGLVDILKGLKATGKDVVINGGDSFVNAYCETGGKWQDILTGINQETVFSCINWEKGTFGKAKKEEEKYFTEYIEKYGEQGVNIYLLEYTSNPVLINKIKQYCASNHFQYYITDSLELDAE